ncbi:hypothetical protein ANN_24353 [Periplaneta americana]|uniref:Uncharacterized protein n=1 Tax=Periplaneta americana TaxID=6978 RepID=A0ABQ8S2U7_PERAM|nr:hypothetical protein ANN_24353 [Periplaneta americana]
MTKSNGEKKRRWTRRSTATWDVKTPLLPGKLENLKEAMRGIRMDVMGISEVRWENSAGHDTTGKVAKPTMVNAATQTSSRDHFEEASRRYAKWEEKIWVDGYLCLQQVESRLYAFQYYSWKGCETWTLTLREEHRLRMFENKVLRKIFGAKRDEVTGEWRKLHNTELHALYSSRDIITNIISRRLRWAGHVARMGESRNAYRVLVGRPKRKRPLGRPRRRWEDNIKMDLREVGYDDRDWINLAQDRDRWRAYVRAAMNLRVKLGRCATLQHDQRPPLPLWSPDTFTA